METSNPPVISVIVPCYNAVKTLPLQLEALSTQIDAPPFEIVLADNRSTDDIRGIYNKFLDRFPAGMLRLIQADAMQGTSYARNVGATHARADHLMFCDSDDVVSAWWIAQGERTFAASEFWGGSAILLEDNVFELSVSQIRMAFGDSPDWLPPVDDQSETTFPVLMGSNFGCTKRAFFSLDGFDQSFPVSGEDNDLAFRARAAGYPLPISRTVRIGYRGRWEVRTRQRLAFRSARAHSLLATRYNAWDHSPFPPPVEELIRCIASGVRMTLRPSLRDWTGLKIRSAAAIGLLSGALDYKAFNRAPQKQTGVGLERMTGVEK